MAEESWKDFEARHMAEQAELLEDSRRLREAVKGFGDGELLAFYVVLEKLGLAEGSTVLEQLRHRNAVAIYRQEVMARMARE